MICGPMKKFLVFTFVLCGFLQEYLYASESLDAQFEKFVLDHQEKERFEAPVYLAFGSTSDLLRLTARYENARTGMRIRTFPILNEDVFGAGPIIVREFHILDFEAPKSEEDTIAFGLQARHRTISLFLKPKDSNPRELVPLFVLIARADQDVPYEHLEELRLVAHPTFWPKTKRGNNSRIAELALREGRNLKYFLGSNVLRSPREDFPLEPFTIEFSRPILSAFDFNWPELSPVVTSTIFQIERHYNPDGLLTNVTASLSRGYREQSSLLYQILGGEFSLSGFTQLRHLAVNLQFEPTSLISASKGQPTGKYNHPHPCREFIGRLFDAEGPKASLGY